MGSSASFPTMLGGCQFKDSTRSQSMIYTTYRASESKEMRGDR